MGDAPGWDTRWTVLELERTADGWRATQATVDVVGEGSTAAAAAADYCAQIARENRSLDGTETGRQTP